ncbi:MAG: AAA family ATPase [Thermoanaerobaculia bacterium]|nr:AAA family ATPase [Thermoanaerobaculia bacterium]
MSVESSQSPGGNLDEDRIETEAVPVPGPATEHDAEGGPGEHMAPPPPSGSSSTALDDPELEIPTQVIPVGPSAGLAEADDEAQSELPTEEMPVEELARIAEQSRQEHDEEQAQPPSSEARPAVGGAEVVDTDPLDTAQTVLARLRARMRAQVLGRDEVIDLVLVALLADGHVLLEDFPGSGKTTLAKSLGASIVDDRLGNAPSLPDDYIAPFRRIQFTPDLLPSDVTGVSVFDAASNRFHFRHGPIFAHVVLADEINRTSPKVQSAMLEAMAEKQVTVDNVTYDLDQLFFVIATQNPLDLAGTYPLPVAQLDRFLFKIRMEHIDRSSELQVLETWQTRRDTERVDLPRVTRSEVLVARHAIDEHVAIDERVKEALVDVAEAVRADERVVQGCSTRSLVLMLPALQSLAALRGRDYVSADDIATLVPRVLGHRVELAPGLDDVQDVLDDALEQALEGLARSTLRKR